MSDELIDKLNKLPQTVFTVGDIKLNHIDIRGYGRNILDVNFIGANLDETMFVTGAIVIRLNAVPDLIAAIAEKDAKVDALQAELDRLSSLETALVGKAQELERKIGRLRAIIRKAEWFIENQIGDEIVNRTCIICNSNSDDEEHTEDCSFYKWGDR